jgi:ribulose-5-phosphate 4-epimerase/fuculose-1-phosphate aldolase
MRESALREQICLIGKSLFDRGYTHGASGNISARLEDGGLLVTSTNVALGRLDPAILSRFDAAGHLLEGPQPTKEMPLHRALYAHRSASGAIVHLHSTHSVAVSMLADIDPMDVFPPLTAYYLMKVGRTMLVPYFRPGDPAVVKAIEALDPACSAVLLANHGPIVAGESLTAASDSIEELEQTAKLYLLLAGRPTTVLSSTAVGEITEPRRDNQSF